MLFYTGVWTNTSSYPNKVVGNVVYPPQTKTRMKGQQDKAAREGRCPQSPAISSEKVHGRKKGKIIIQTLTVTTEFIRRETFCYSFASKIMLHFTPNCAACIGEKCEQRRNSREPSRTSRGIRSHLGTLIQLAGFREVTLFLTRQRRMKGAL